MQKDLDVVLPMNNLIEYSKNCLRTSGRFWRSYRDKKNDNLIGSESFKSQIEITGNIPADGNTKNVKIFLSLKILK